MPFDLELFTEENLESFQTLVLITGSLDILPVCEFAFC